MHESYDCVKKADHYCIEMERCGSATQTQSEDKKKFNELINTNTS